MYNKQFAFYQNILSFENTLYHQNISLLRTVANKNVLFFQKTRANFWAAVGIPLSYLSIYYILIIKLTFVLFWMTWNCAKTHFVCECMRVSFGWSVAADCNSLKSRFRASDFWKGFSCRDKTSRLPRLPPAKLSICCCLFAFLSESSTY